MTDDDKKKDKEKDDKKDDQKEPPDWGSMKSYIPNRKKDSDG